MESCSLDLERFVIMERITDSRDIVLLIAVLLIFIAVTGFSRQASFVTTVPTMVFMILPAKVSAIMTVMDITRADTAVMELLRMRKKNVMTGLTTAFRDTVRLIVLSGLIAGTE
jgi:hypothetical protein